MCGKRDLRSISKGFFESVEIVKSQSFEGLNLCVHAILYHLKLSRATLACVKCIGGLFNIVFSPNISSFFFTKYLLQYTFLHQLYLASICETQPSSIQRLSSSIFPCSSFVVVCLSVPHGNISTV